MTDDDPQVARDPLRAALLDASASRPSGRGSARPSTRSSTAGQRRSSSRRPAAARVLTYQLPGRRAPGHHARHLAARRADGGPGAVARGARRRGDLPRLDARARRAPTRAMQGMLARRLQARLRRARAARVRRLRARLARARRSRSRHRRGPLHRAVGPRLPPRLPAHRRRCSSACDRRACWPAPPPRRPTCATRSSSGCGFDRRPRAGRAPRLRAPEPAPRGAHRRRPDGVEGDRAPRELRARRSASPRRPTGGAIVYAATRKTTEQYADDLRHAGWNAAPYHAGLGADGALQASPSASATRKLDVVVATNAFGMGIDRADIRAVLHLQPPSSIESYYQEVGRAGRDGAEAHGLLLCSGMDIALRRRLTQMGTDGRAAEPAQAARAWSLFRELLRYLDARHLPPRLHAPLLRRRAGDPRRLRPL